MNALESMKFDVFSAFHKKRKKMKWDLEVTNVHKK